MGIVDNPKTFYKEAIAPYKGEIETWFIANMSLRVYILLIIATIYVVVTKDNSLIFKMFKECPRPKDKYLHELLSINT